MITIKLGELRSIVEGLNDILTKELPIKPAYWFGKLAKNLHKETVEFEETRINLAKKYAVTDKEGAPQTKDGRYVLTNEGAFNAEFKELLDTEIEVNFNPCTIDQLGDVRVNPVTLMALDKFITEGETKSE